MVAKTFRQSVFLLLMQHEDGQTDGRTDGRSDVSDRRPNKVCWFLSQLQGNVNEVPKNMSRDFKCGHASALTPRWSAESCPTVIRLLMTGLN